MKSLLTAFLFLLFVANAFAQKSDEILAIANGQNYTSLDLTPEARQNLENLPRILANARQSLLEQQITDALFEMEAAAQKTTVEKLIAREIEAKIPAPTEAQIKAIYDANRQAIGNRTLEEVRPQIVNFLKSDQKKSVFGEYVSNLKLKYKVALGKDVNAANLTRFENLATVGDRQISVSAFEAKNKTTLSEIEADVYDEARGVLEQTIYSNLLIAEAKAQNIGAGDLVAREITDKIKNYSDDEQLKLETALRQKLFQKYNAKFLLKEIPPLVQTVSVDDDPAQGKINAPVTVVMFTDFQCPACSATHPVLKQVLSEYADKIRFVVRDFPLVTIHENAFQAALAAGAANAQGKFFEYTEVLYKNQTALDAVSLKKYAADLGLNLKQFELDLASPKIADEVRKDMADGKNLGINGTPTIFVNGVKARVLSAEGFRQAIERALKK